MMDKQEAMRIALDKPGLHAGVTWALAEKVLEDAGEPVGRQLAGTKYRVQRAEWLIENHRHAEALEELRQVPGNDREPGSR